MHTPPETQEFHKIRLEKTADNFRKHGFEVVVFDCANDAKEHFLNVVDPTQSVGFGGSRTVTDLGIIEAMIARKQPLLDRGAPGAVRAQVERDCFSADVFIASANAVSETGAIVNIDMWGNRTAAIEFGPKKVYLFVGRNKIACTLEEAIQRARNQASVMNCIRFSKKTPCTHDGKCHDCSSPDRICSILSIIERAAPQGRIALLIFNEEAGF